MKIPTVKKISPSPGGNNDCIFSPGSNKHHYGFLHPCSSVNLETIRISIETANGTRDMEIKLAIKKYVPNCPDCGGELEYLYSVLPYMIPPKESG